MATKKGLYNSAQMTAQLPKEVKECFKVVGLNRKSSTRILFPKYGIVDFKRLTLKKANHLHKMKFPYLEAVKSVKPEKQKSE